MASRPADPPAGLAGAAFLSAAGLVVVVMACSLVGPRGSQKFGTAGQSRCPLANPPDVLATPARARPVAADASPRASFRLEVGAGGYPQTHERSQRRPARWPAGGFRPTSTRAANDLRPASLLVRGRFRREPPSGFEPETYALRETNHASPVTCADVRDTHADLRLLRSVVADVSRCSLTSCVTSVSRESRPPEPRGHRLELAEGTCGAALEVCTSPPRPELSLALHGLVELLVQRA